MEQLDRRTAGMDADASWRERVDIPAGLIEVIVAASLGLVALWLWIGSYSFAEGEGGLSGAIVFPRGVSLVLGAACLFLAFQGARQLRRGDPTEAPVAIRRPGAVAASVILIILYPLLLSFFGFYATTGVWLLVLLWVAGQRNPIWAIVTAVGFLAVAKFVFQMAMGIPLP